MIAVQERKARREPDSGHELANVAKLERDRTNFSGFSSFYRPLTTSFAVLAVPGTSGSMTRWSGCAFSIGKDAKFFGRRRGDRAWQQGGPLKNAFYRFLDRTWDCVR
jgi:hypothetical protein